MGHRKAQIPQLKQRRQICSHSGDSSKAAARAAVKKDDEAEIRIIKALEKPISVDVENVEIRPATRELAGAAGIPIEIEPGTLDLLPYGSKTVIRSLKIEQQPLSKSLPRLLGPIALTFMPTKTHLAIVPTEPLRR